MVVGPVCEIPVKVEVYVPLELVENSKPESAAIEIVALNPEPVKEKLVGAEAVP
jgi:hypothetical protein